MKSFNLTEWALGHRAVVLFLILVIAVGGVLGFMKLGQLDLQSGRHLLHTRGDDELAGRQPGYEDFVAAIPVHRDADQLDGSHRLGARAANDPHCRLPAGLGDRACRDHGHRSFRGG